MAKPIVFVCIENSCRSQLAEAFARIHNPGGFEIHSAGSRPSGRVNEKAIAAMAELGYDLTRHTSKSLDALPSVVFAAVITMGCGDACPSLRGEIHEDWGIPDPKHLPPAAFNCVRDEIEAKVKALFARLSSENLACNETPFLNRACGTLVNVGREQ
ncbi:MAG: arsenate reductase ArsC [Chloracidobacterium sp.]|uniref:Arsenate reductase ArsC n=1 Tax=Chloracidobacterium validum TaxID=2821543 RepID=A0ABX8BA14_9BACT|nr:arsenate reductase ArsC [Chloracidobacterium validum]QUW03723.1 arsenate reductase ArsC [Chloracidobacterium validum]